MAKRGKKAGLCYCCNGVLVRGLARCVKKTCIYCWRDKVLIKVLSGCNKKISYRECL